MPLIVMHRTWVSADRNSWRLVLPVGSFYSIPCINNGERKCSESSVRADERANSLALLMFAARENFRRSTTKAEGIGINLVTGSQNIMVSL